MPRKNILLERLPAPKQIKLPNVLVFFAKCQKIGRYALAPTGVKIDRTYIRKI